MVFMLAFVQLLTRRDLGEQVNHRRAVQRQMAGIDHALQLFIRLVQQNEDVEGFFTLAALDKTAQAAQADKAEARRKREILLQQAIAVKVTQIVRKQRLVRLKALLAQRDRRQQLPLRLRADRLTDDPGVVLHHQLQQLQRFNVRTGEEKFQTVEIQMPEILRTVAGDADPQGAADLPLAQAQLRERQIGGHAAQLDPVDLQRQQVDLVRRGIAAGDAGFFSARLSIMVPRGTMKPLLRSPRLLSGAISAMAIDGVGAR